MLNIDSIQNGIVIDHIQAGKGMRIYELLELDKLDCCVAKNGELVKKENIVLPRRIKNVVKCKNPRCITSTEENLDQIFVLCDEKAHRYRCLYCEQAYKSHE